MIENKNKESLTKEAPRKQRGADKVARIPIKVEPTTSETRLRKPSWIRAKFPGGKEVKQLKDILRNNSLHTVCEEASCPNMGECFRDGVASFMIMGDICTRRCPFCDVAHGKPNSLDTDEPKNLAKTVANMKLNHAVITSVNRDDLKDGGASHFAECTKEIRRLSPKTTVEILTPDFRGRMDKALKELAVFPPDVFNHNLETVPSLYKACRPGADYKYSLELLKRFKEEFPNIPSKSGLMVGLGENDDEILEVLKDMREHNVEMLTLGQYLQPSSFHLPVKRYVSPEMFLEFKKEAEKMGFIHVASAPMVRSSYHADISAHKVLPNT